MNRDEYIMNRLLEHYQQIKDKYEVVGIFIQGSQNYNLDIYDEDYKLYAIISIGVKLWKFIIN